MSSTCTLGSVEGGLVLSSCINPFYIIESILLTYLYMPVLIPSTYLLAAISLSHNSCLLLLAITAYH